jgi:hypothetical protein
LGVGVHQGYCRHAISPHLHTRTRAAMVTINLNLTCGLKVNTDMMWYLLCQSRWPHSTFVKCTSQKHVHVAYSDAFRFHESTIDQWWSRCKSRLVAHHAYIHRFHSYLFYIGLYCYMLFIYFLYYYNYCYLFYFVKYVLFCYKYFIQ